MDSRSFKPDARCWRMRYPAEAVSTQFCQGHTCGQGRPCKEALRNKEYGKGICGSVRRLAIGCIAYTPHTRSRHTSSQVITCRNLEPVFACVFVCVRVCVCVKVCVWLRACARTSVFVMSVVELTEGMQAAVCRAPGGASLLVCGKPTAICLYWIIR